MAATALKVSLESVAKTFVQRDRPAETLRDVILRGKAAAVCLSRVYLGAHFPLDIAAGAGLGLLIGGVLNLVFGVPNKDPSAAHASRLP